MDTLTDAERRAFSLWLRTGRLPGPASAAAVELKFNPWHDPANGRFTFAGTGRFFGPRSGGTSESGGATAHSKRKHFGPFGGSGGSYDRVSKSRQNSSSTSGPQSKRPEMGFPGGKGSFGGGGVSLSYTVPEHAESQRTRTEMPGTQPTAARPVQSKPGVSPPIAARAPGEKWRREERNGYTYLIDTHRRTRYVSGALTTNEAQPRSRSAQAAAGKPDRRTSDDGGHYIARRFNGPTDAFNHFAQDANFNRGTYRALEEEWAKETRAGKRVEVNIMPLYKGGSRRPSLINIWFWVNGKRKSVRFPNEPRENSSGKR